VLMFRRCTSSRMLLGERGGGEGGGGLIEFRWDGPRYSIWRKW